MSAAACRRFDSERHVAPLAEFGSARNIPVRFIELMPLTPGGPLNEGHFFPVAEAMENAVLPQVEDIVKMARAMLA